MNNNHDILLESRIRSSLQTETSSRFTENLMKRIEINAMFRVQEKSMNKIVRNTIFSILALISLIAGFMVIVLSGRSETKDEQYATGITDFFSKAGEFILELFSNLGLISRGNTFLSILLLILVIGIFLLGDYVFSKIKADK